MTFVWSRVYDGLIVDTVAYSRDGILDTAHLNWACRRHLIIQCSVFLFDLRFPENLRHMHQQHESKAVQKLARGEQNIK